MRIFCAGSFDVIQVGHVNLLLYCRELAGVKGEVHISIDSDEKVMIDKGLDRPIFEWRERADAVLAISFAGNKIVDRVHLHKSNDYLQDLIRHIIRPDIIVVGSDYRDKKVIGCDIAEVKYFDRDWRFSSTRTIEACRKNKNQ